MSQTLLDRAIGGDELAFRELTAPHERELEFHCYRMLGSLQDAEDVLQETLIAAWRALPSFERRASVSTWLYRIATNRCLNAIRDKRRRPPTPPEAPFPIPAATRNADPHWLEPYPDERLGWVADAEPGPDARYETREAVELAFVAALQQLPARQRAVLILRDVLGFRAEEVAAMLGGSVESVKSALKRARATLAAERPGTRSTPTPERERELVAGFVEAFLADDIDAIVALLTDDAWITMPPATPEYRGARLAGEFLAAVAAWRAGQPARVLVGAANGQAAFGVYREDPSTGVAACTGVIVLALSAEGIERITWFLGPSYAQLLGMPAQL